MSLQEVISPKVINYQISSCVLLQFPFPQNNLILFIPEQDGMYLLLHVTLLVVEAFQLTWQTDLFTPSTTISVRHFQRKKNTVQ